MKLYLSSYRIPNPDEFFEFVGKGQSLKMALIYNAHDPLPEAERDIKFAERTAYFRDLGFVITEIDLREYHDAERLRDDLMAADVVWINGGNSYYLRYIMQVSGFDRIVRDVLADGVVYAGDSAGAVVAGPTLKYIEEADDPNDAPEVIYAGIKLTDVAIVPHWSSEKYAEILHDIHDSLVDDGFNVVTLTDDQALFIDGGSTWVSPK